MSLPHLENAQESIKKVFNDITVDRKTTRLNLEELSELIDDYLAALDDADNEHDYERQLIMNQFPDTSIDHAAQEAIDKASEPVGDYQCGQCGERCWKDQTRSCFYCETRYCPNCRKRCSDPITNETVEVCSEHAEKVQEIWNALKKVRGGGEKSFKESANEKRCS